MLRRCWCFYVGLRANQSIPQSWKHCPWFLKWWIHAVAFNRFIWSLHYRWLTFAASLGLEHSAAETNVARSESELWKLRLFWRFQQGLAWKSNKVEIKHPECDRPLPQPVAWRQVSAALIVVCGRAAGTAGFRFFVVIFLLHSICSLLFLCLYVQTFLIKLPPAVSSVSMILILITKL